MKLQSTRFGEVEYQEKDLIKIANGLIGMPDNTNFIILDFEDEIPFKWLQNIQDPSVGFLVGDPLLFKPDYELALSQSEIRDLGVSAPQDLAIFVICTFQDQVEKTTGNLLGPIVVHVANRVGIQLIVEDSGFSTNESLYGQPQAEEMKTQVCEQNG
jgi:flagellar assembly factor FliW